MSDGNVFLEESVQIEVEHPSGICPEGIFTGSEGIGQREAVGKSEGVAFNFSGCDQPFCPVEEIDIDKIGQSIPSMSHGIEQICPKPDCIAGGIVGLVQMQPQLLLLLAPDPLKIQRNAVHPGRNIDLPLDIRFEFCCKLYLVHRGLLGLYVLNSQKTNNHYQYPCP